MSKKYNFIIIMHNSDVKNIAFKNKTQLNEKYTKNLNET